MKFNYRSNKLLELQKKHGSVWVNKLGETEVLKQFHKNARRQGKSYDWHEQSTQLRSDIYKSQKFKILHFTKATIEKARQYRNIYKSIQAFQATEQGFGCILFEDQRSVLYGIYKNKISCISLQGDCIENAELITFNDVEKGHSISCFYQSLAESVQDLHPEAAKMIDENLFYVSEELIQLLTIYYFATIEKHSIHCNKVRKVVIENEKYINETEIPIQIIHTAPFNQLELDPATGFAVSGHFRLQPCGKEGKERKLIWIDKVEKQSSTPPAPQDSL